MTVDDAGDPSADEDRIETQLRDGTRVLIRMVSPDDKAALASGFERLSPRSRYLRFHTAVEQLSHQQLAYLTEVDQVNHVAWVAQDLDQPDEPGIGVARFIRLDDEPTVAEAAVTVLDEYQGRGLGSELLHVLAAAAVRRGITTFRAYVLGENRSMLALLDALGPTHTERQLGVYQIDVELPAVSDDARPSAAHRVFSAVTGKHLPPMHTTAPPVWLSDDDTDGTGRQRLRDWLDQMLTRRSDSGRSEPQS
ncbi:MAG: GNAT family N-acetyltransferase [Actinobacteria bacterium]|nr:GNAT family N-acetyltransferase [Actinomycetota bacterium]